MPDYSRPEPATASHHETPIHRFRNRIYISLVVGYERTGKEFASRWQQIGTGRARRNSCTGNRRSYGRTRTPTAPPTKFHREAIAAASTLPHLKEQIGLSNPLCEAARIIHLRLTPVQRFNSHIATRCNVPTRNLQRYLTPLHVQY